MEETEARRGGWRQRLEMEETEAGRGGWSLRRLEAATGDRETEAGKRWLELEAAGGSDWRWRRQRLEEVAGA